MSFKQEVIWKIKFKEKKKVLVIIIFEWSNMKKNLWFQGTSEIYSAYLLSMNYLAV